MERIRLELCTISIELVNIRFDQLSNRLNALCVEISTHPNSSTLAEQVADYSIVTTDIQARKATCRPEHCGNLFELSLFQYRAFKQTDRPVLEYFLSH